MPRFVAGLALILAAALCADNNQSAEEKERLSKLQLLVGTWRGVGQPQRGSTKDSWTEEADWAWSFDQGEPALVGKQPKSKYFSQLRLTAGPKSGEFVLVASPATGGELLRYIGKLDDQQQLVLTADNPRDDLPRRLSFRFVAGGDRLLVLMEKQGLSGDLLVRLAEVGYTRQGSGFGKNLAQRECVVTGGLGTIEVSHDGKAYFVCCTGCRDYFNENPKQVLAEYAERKTAEKVKK
jgi:ribosomal protein L24E